MYEKFGRAEKLLMRIRSLKWNALNLRDASPDSGTRDEAGVIVASLDAAEAGARADASEAGIAAFETQVDSLALRLAKVSPPQPR